MCCGLLQDRGVEALGRVDVAHSVRHGVRVHVGLVLWEAVGVLEDARAHQDGAPVGTGLVGAVDVRVRIVADAIDGLERDAATLDRVQLLLRKAARPAKRQCCILY